MPTKGGEKKIDVMETKWYIVLAALGRFLWCFMSIHFISLSCAVYVYLSPGTGRPWFTGNVIQHERRDPALQVFVPLWCQRGGRVQDRNEDLIITIIIIKKKHTLCHIELKNPTGMQILKERTLKMF